MRRARRAIGLLAAAALLAGNAGPVVATDTGRVRGEALEQGAAWRGIPYALPPVGALRWREARPVRPWKGIRDATRFGFDCPQKPEGDRPTHAQGEDCLTLSIVTPDRAAKRLPVLFSIHGGAYAFGSGRYMAEAGLSPLVRGGVILVSPNYRVGRFGFFAHPALVAEAGHGTGNFWLSDQLRALEWTRRNIARFGGDPGNITILGCSAGGSSVNALMASPAARGLFARASAHSGGGFFNATRPLDRAEAEGVAFAARAGVTDKGSAGLAALRRLSIAEVLAADPGPPAFGAIVDGRLLTDRISAIFARGEQAPVPFIAGSTSNEASVFGLMGFDAPTLKRLFGIDLDSWRPIYEADGPLSDAELIRRVQTDFIFTSAALGMAGLAARRAPAWSYHFDFVPPAERASAPGAPHCADMPYLFGVAPEDDPRTAAMARRWRGLWLNFLRSGDPNGAGPVIWPRTVPGALETLLVRDRMTVTQGIRPAAIAAWHKRWRRETGLSIQP
ncbi:MULTISPECIES: carboxylesterase family protein [unclassified Sphingomonas]|uniref:carboxylesterase/lipase family protein n=1 Tax=unclassified Sphingomonas TaxID=196159 RepID=UPI000AC50790|nr:MULTISPECIES: carboxylesterase family protein [unclassified Sphingomonas]MBN8849293.1 carboxylesterase family protein [Sphingomonas sp.]